MLENLIFATNGTIPLFLLMVLGFAIRKLKVIDNSFVKTANNFNFTVTLPVLLFTDMAETNFKETFDLKYFLFCFITTSIVFWGLWGLAKLFMKDKFQVAEFVQACYRSSLAVNGVALVESIYGNASMAGVMILGSVPLFNIYAVILLQTSSPNKLSSDEAAHERRRALLGILKNPIIIGVILGFLSSLIGIEYPKIINSALHYVGRIGTPLALICIGADFDLAAAFRNLGKSTFAAIVKLIILPLIVVPVAILMGFHTEKLICILIMVASPTTPVAFIMAKKYGHAGTITSSTVALTTLFSSLTITLFVFVLRTMGYL